MATLEDRVRLRIFAIAEAWIRNSVPWMVIGTFFKRRSARSPFPRERVPSIYGDHLIGRGLVDINGAIVTALLDGNRAAMLLNRALRSKIRL